MNEHIIPGRAHTPEQKRTIIEKLYKIWLDVPTLRLGQLMYIVGGSSFDSPTFFYMEDETLITELEKHIIPSSQSHANDGISIEEVASLSEALLNLAKFEEPQS